METFRLICCSKHSPKVIVAFFLSVNVQQLVETNQTRRGESATEITDSKLPRDMHQITVYYATHYALQMFNIIHGVCLHSLL